MRKVSVITNGTLPVPSILGGAAEKLTQTLLDFNELSNDNYYSIFTIKANLSVKNSMAYKNSAFFLIDDSTFFFKIKKKIRYIINKIIKNRIKNQFLKEVFKYEDEIKKTDVILISNNPLYAKYLKKKFKKNIILHLHNDYINTNENNIFNESLKYIDKIICVSEYLKKRVLAVNKDINISVVHNGINLLDFHLLKNNQQERALRIRENFNIKLKDIVFVFSGRLQKSKGLHLVVDAFIELQKNKNNIKLIVLGGSKYAKSSANSFTKELLVLIEEKAKNNIIFTGFINYENMSAYYQASDIAILPSIEPEAFGLTSIEAQASGLPVVISSSGGMPETINSESGFIVDLEKNIKDQLFYLMNLLVETDSLRQYMSIKALNNALLFSDEKYYNSMKIEINNI